MSIASQSPDEFAYRLMKGPGYMAVSGGEVVHIIKCVAVAVKIQNGNFCYAELEVTKNNETYFLTPRTHILKRKGTQIMCNAFIPNNYQIGEMWIKIMPRPIEARNPVTIKPMTRATWKYVNPENLATSGIYTEKDIKDLRERIMFPVEKPAVLNDLARKMHGQPIAGNGRSIFRLLDEEVVEKIAESAWTKMWSKFIIFGSASAGVVAIIFILHLIKGLFDIIIRGYTLYNIFGWLFHLLGAIFSSVAHCLTIISQPEEQIKNEQIPYPKQPHYPETQSPEI